MCHPRTFHCRHVLLHLVTHARGCDAGAAGRFEGGQSTSSAHVRYCCHEYLKAVANWGTEQTGCEVNLFCLKGNCSFAVETNVVGWWELKYWPDTHTNCCVMLSHFVISHFPLPHHFLFFPILPYTSKAVVYVFPQLEELSTSMYPFLIERLFINRFE